MQKIKHIGVVRAQEMLTLRPFSSVDDMKRIKGIGQKRVAEIKEQGPASPTRLNQRPFKPIACPSPSFPRRQTESRPNPTPPLPSLPHKPLVLVSSDGDTVASQLRRVGVGPEKIPPLTVLGIPQFPSMWLWYFRADAELRGKWVLRGEPALVDSSSPRYGEKASYYSGGVPGDGGVVDATTIRVETEDQVSRDDIGLLGLQLLDADHLDAATGNLPGNWRESNGCNAAASCLRHWDRL